MSEKQKHDATEQIENQHIDAEWFDEFVDIETNQVFEYFRGNAGYRQEQRQLFEAGEIAIPSLDYPALDLDALREKEARFLDLKQRILDDESAPESLKQIYRWGINERLAENRMVQQAALAAQAETPEARRAHMRRFERYNEFLYGPQNQEVFDLYANQIRSEALSVLDSSDDEEARAAATRVLEMFPEEKAVSFDIPALTEGATRDEFRDIVLREYGLSPESVAQFIESEGDMSPSEFVAYCEQRQAEIPGSEPFTTFVAEGVSGITFNPARQELSVGEIKNGKDRVFKPREALGLEMHENQGHLGRSARGYSSKLKILGFGLDRNFKPEEGNAMFNESAISEKGDTMTGWAGVVAVGLARGLNREPGHERIAERRDFAGTYAALKDIYMVREIAAGKSVVDAEKTAKTNAWDRSVRTFRGTTSDAPGVVYQKDIGYGEGFLETHAFFDAQKERIVLLKFGRFNAMSSRHIQVLVELGVLDEELATLAA